MKEEITPIAQGLDQNGFQVILISAQIHPVYNVAYLNINQGL